MAEVNSRNKVNGDNNTTVGRDIINYNVGPLEQFICTQVSQELIPKIKEQTDIVSKFVGEKMHDIIEKEIISPFKDEVRKINLTFHFNEVQKAIKQSQKEDIQPSKPQSKTEELKRLESFNDWTTEVQNIPEEEKELSKIWQGWFIEFHKGNNIDDLRLAMKYMKGLTADEAMVLLYFNNPAKLKNTLRKRLSESSYEPRQWKHLQNKIDYLYEQLLEKKLIAPKKGNKSLLYTTIGISIGILFALFAFLQYKNNFYDDPFKPVLIFISLIGIIWLYYLLWVVKNKYEMTWAGEAIVKYAKLRE